MISPIRMAKMTQDESQSPESDKPAVRVQPWKSSTMITRAQCYLLWEHMHLIGVSNSIRTMNILAKLQSA